MSSPGLNLNQVRTLVVRPALTAIGLWSVAAEQLVLGTGLYESGYHFLHQEGGGPALGLWQMEPATHEDLWVNYIPAHASISQPLLSLVAARGPLVPQLAWNLQYAAAMCRILYARLPAALPAAGDVLAQAAYYKQFYNTPAGAATVETARVAFEAVCAS